MPPIPIPIIPRPPIGVNVIPPPIGTAPPSQPESSFSHGVSHFASPHFTASVADPAHVAPHTPGAGLSHLRVRVFVPPPQVVEQAQNSPHAPQLPLTIAVPHGLVSDADPTHDAPHALGAGLLH